MTEQWRTVVVLPVTADSPLGRAADPVATVTAHLPPHDSRTRCALCPDRAWPCHLFNAAARDLAALGIPVGYLVPLELHPVLWPPTSTPPPDPRTTDTPGAPDG
ncbi:hypothetical protein [Saccharothrix xinjiangensis]|uniref:Uncharacterized protein n=1 Tax=Saccharothrix xinjiangensis TaxID=204798 RepID=A0ABV9XY12_9PSEU